MVLLDGISYEAGCLVFDNLGLITVGWGGRASAEATMRWCQDAALPPDPGVVQRIRKLTSQRGPGVVLECSASGSVQSMMAEGAIKDPTAFATHRISIDEAPEFFGEVCACSDNVLKTVILF